MRQLGRNSFNSKWGVQVFARIMKMKINKIKLIDRGQHRDSPGPQSDSGHSWGDSRECDKGQHSKGEETHMTLNTGLGIRGSEAATPLDLSLVIVKILLA